MAPLIRNALRALALSIAMTGAPAAHATETLQLVEQKIKAGLIYNFLKYTRWPGAAETSPLVVCLLGGDPFDGHLAPMAGRTVNHRTIKVRTVSGTADAADCAVLIVHAAEKPSWAALQKSLAGRDVLTVSDFEGFAAKNGMIEFARIDDRIGVKVNVDAVAVTHLEVHERLLKLASIVHTQAGQR